MRHALMTGVLALSMTVAPSIAYTGGAQGPDKRPASCVIGSIDHEINGEMTRVILHGNAPIDYRGGMLRGSQVVIDLANVQVSLPQPVVEVGAPEVDRVVIGPEISRDGEKVLKVRLMGVKTASHKVISRGNDLQVELTALIGARDVQKGLPKLIINDSEVKARADQVDTLPSIVWAKAIPIGTDGNTVEPAVARSASAEPVRAEPAMAGASNVEPASTAPQGAKSPVVLATSDVAPVATLAPPAPAAANAASISLVAVSAAP